MKKNTFIIIGIIIIIISIFLYRHYSIGLDIKNNKEITTGKVIKLLELYQARYSLQYEYFVNENRYTGQTGIDPFVCLDGTKNAIGKQFTVYYSSKNPGNSRIDLGKYEKHKTTIEFVK
jgi:hypothetical protein